MRATAQRRATARSWRSRSRFWPAGRCQLRPSRRDRFPQLQGQGLGSVLLADALRRLALATEDAAARYVVVDAITDDRAASFDEAHGFSRMPDSTPPRP